MFVELGGAERGNAGQSRSRNNCRCCCRISDRSSLCGRRSTLTRSRRSSSLLSLVRARGVVAFALCVGERALVLRLRVQLGAAEEEERERRAQMGQLRERKKQYSKKILFRKKEKTEKMSLILDSPF